MILLKRVSTSRGIITIIAAILILFGGVFAYQYFFVKPELTEQNNRQLVGGDKDSHGCLSAAGYFWCEVKQKCLRVWEEPCEADLTAGWETYTNAQYGFEVKYPVTAALVESNENGTWFGGTDQVSIKTVATISTPNERARDAFVSVFVANGANAVANCSKQNLNGQAPKITKTQNINGVDFYVLGYQDSAMGGHRDNVTQYSILKNNLCYLLQGNATWSDIQFVHGATDGKQATQQELGEQNKKIKDGQNFVDSIISTFKFTNVATTKEQKCTSSGGTVNTIDCYCSGSIDFQDNCAIGGCACPPNPAYKKTVKSCDCGPEKCFDGEKCIAFPL